MLIPRGMLQWLIQMSRETAVKACWYLDRLVGVAAVAVLELQLNRPFIGKAYPHFPDRGGHASRRRFWHYKSMSIKHFCYLFCVTHSVKMQLCIICNTGITVLDNGE